jgi:tRNA-dependent cyclodipeptide synthase
MSNYKIEVRGAGWRERKKESASLLISVGQSYCEDSKLLATVAWIQSNFSECFVDVADTLQRYNLIALNGLSPDEALSIATKNGVDWLARNENILNNLTIPFTIRHWDSWLNHEDFSTIIIDIHQLYASNAAFRDKVNHDIIEFVRRRENDGLITGPDIKIKFAEQSLRFVLEEIAVSIIMGREKPASVIYSAKELSSYNSIRTAQIKGAPYGLENYDYIRITHRSRHIDDNNKILLAA